MNKTYFVVETNADFALDSSPKYETIDGAQHELKQLNIGEDLTVLWKIYKVTALVEAV